MDIEVIGNLVHVAAMCQYEFNAYHNILFVYFFFVDRWPLKKQKMIKFLNRILSNGNDSEVKLK